MNKKNLMAFCKELRSIALADVASRKLRTQIVDNPKGTLWVSIRGFEIYENVIDHALSAQLRIEPVILSGRLKHIKEVAIIGDLFDHRNRKVPNIVVTATPQLVWAVIQLYQFPGYC